MAPPQLENKYDKLLREGEAPPSPAKNEYDAVLDRMIQDGRWPPARAEQPATDYAPVLACLALVVFWLLAARIVKRHTTLRFFGGNPIERIGAVLFWPTAFLISVASAGSIAERGFSRTWDDLVQAASDEASEKAMTMVLIAMVAGAFLRFLAIPIARWVFTGRFAKSQHHL